MNGPSRPPFIAPSAQKTDGPTMGLQTYYRQLVRLAVSKPSRRYDRI